MKEAILAIRAGKRRDNVEALQQTLTKHGCCIAVRLGLHAAGLVCGEDGLIILQLIGQDEDFEALKADLQEIPELKFNYMEI